MIDLEVFDAALAHIRAHPEEHDQAAWIRRSPCGAGSTGSTRTRSDSR